MRNCFINYGRYKLNIIALLYLDYSNYLIFTKLIDFNIHPQETKYVFSGFVFIIIIFIVFFISKYCSCGVSVLGRFNRISKFANCEL